MRGKICSSLILFAVLPLFLLGSCTRKEVSTEIKAMPEETAAEPVNEQAVPAGDEVTDDVYDLETEMPGEEDEEEVFEERLEPIEPDTFAVEDLSPSDVTGAEYGVGYRIQVFASGELGKARLFREKVASETGLAAYIEYEGNLYKVRAGDFPTREEAVEARTRLMPFYPDCWIVETTIVK